jgi:hypothetical protein
MANDRAHLPAIDGETVAIQFLTDPRLPGLLAAHNPAAAQAVADRVSPASIRNLFETGNVLTYYLHDEDPFGNSNLAHLAAIGEAAPAADRPRIARIIVLPTSDVYCFVAAAVLATLDPAVPVELVLLHNSRQDASSSALFPLVLELGRDSVRSASAPTPALLAHIPHLPRLERLTVLCFDDARGDRLVSLPEALRSASPSLRTLTIHHHRKRGPADPPAELHFPPGLKRLCLWNLDRGNHALVAAALADQGITLEALAMNGHSLGSGEWRVWLPPVAGLRGEAGRDSPLRELLIQTYYMTDMEDFDALFRTLCARCTALERLSLSVWPGMAHDRTWTPAGPLPALPPSLVACSLDLGLWRDLTSGERHCEAVLGSVLDALSGCTRLEGLSLRVKLLNYRFSFNYRPGSSLFCGARLARALADAPLRTLEIGLRGNEADPPTSSASPWIHAWIAASSPRVRASLRKLQIEAAFPEPAAGEDGTAAFGATMAAGVVVRALLPAFPNLRELLLHDVRVKSYREAERNPSRADQSLAPLAAELRGWHPLRRLLTMQFGLGAPLAPAALASRYPVPLTRAQLDRWAAEVREAAGSRAAWAVCREGIQHAQERRVRGSAPPGRPPSPIERLPPGVLRRIAEMLAYSPETELRVN